MKASVQRIFIFGAAFVAHGKSNVWGDRPYSSGHLYQMLSNPIYAGKIRHKDKLYNGQHEAIIDRKTFVAVPTPPVAA